MIEDSASLESNILDEDFLKALAAEDDEVSESTVRELTLKIGHKSKNTEMKKPEKGNAFTLLGGQI